VCTVSWTPLAGGYALAMNRDERRTRAPANPPEYRVLGGVAVLLPRDGEAGGTWIAVNALGHTLALLNRWDESPIAERGPDREPRAGPGPFVSRGLLVLELAATPHRRAVDEALTRIPLVSYRPFTLVSLSPGELPWLFEWDGRGLERASVVAPGLVRASSGSDQAGAERERGKLFKEGAARPGGLTPEVLFALHRTHRPERGPLSICMHREEAVTVSLSLITVFPSLVRFRYVDGSPCESGPGTEMELGR
jgi:transport and Golgi organization protein 2